MRPILPVIIGMILSLIVYPAYIKLARKTGLLSHDLNKPDKPLVVKFAGPVFLTIVIFLLSIYSSNVFPFSVILIGLMGLLDDLIDIKDLYKTVIPMILSISIIFNVTGTSIFFPLIGYIDFGIFYYFIALIAMGAASNLPNLLGGFNGLEVLLGIIIFTLIIPFAGQHIYLIMSGLGALIGLFLFNRYPARIFPGNAVSYFIGATIGYIAIVTHNEFIIALFLLPQIIEFFLKSRSFFAAENFGNVDEHNKLHYEGPIYSLTHLVMRLFNPNEVQLVIILSLFQFIVGILLLVLHFKFSLI